MTEEPTAPSGKGSRIWTPSLDEGVDYKTLARVIFGSKFILPPLGIIYKKDIEAAEKSGVASITYRFRALIRGKGKTGTYQDREIQIPLFVARLMAFETYDHYLMHKARIDNPSLPSLEQIEIIHDYLTEQGFDLSKIVDVRIEGDGEEMFLRVFSTIPDNGGL